MSSVCGWAANALTYSAATHPAPMMPTPYRAMSLLLRRPCSELRAGVVEGSAVAAHARVAERQRVVLDEELVGDQLLAGPIVTGDDTAHRLVALIAATDPERDLLADAQ